MDKSIIFEKVKKIVAENLKIESSEVTLNTEISENVKPAYTPSPSPSPNNSWFSWLPIISSSSGYDLMGTDLTKIEIIMALEEEFDIDIPEEDAENIKIVQQVLDYIYKKLVV